MCFRPVEKSYYIITLLKPGEPPEQITSYRPITLLPSWSKLFENLVLSIFKILVEEKRPIPDHKFGTNIKPMTNVTNVINIQRWKKIVMLWSILTCCV